ncbi:MAG: DUF2336 domain-containing protein [Rhodospirillaceae bacterium]|nr:DUF2336 domain-containing protein [Rhodospirillaceae bacterium]MDD9929284.1 DUF2336 domain-containing protein [Rhodospirillaceae bacterium]
MSTHNEKLLELAMQRAVHGKGDLAASLAETCLAPGAGLTEKELTLAYDIVRILIGSVDVGIRRHLSEYLADRTDLPGDLVTALIHDDIAVAYPILVHNQTLDDSTLIEVIDRRGKLHRMAVTIRDGLSTAISRSLFATADLDVIESLLYNKTADIDPDTFDAIVHDFGELSALHIPLVHRRELSSAQAHHLSDRVSRSLRRHLATHFTPDMEHAETGEPANS